MPLLTRVEEMYLVAIWELKESAYGVTIRKKIAQRLGKTVSYGGLYFALDQLVKKGLVIKTAGEPTAKRGGRTRFFYTLTQEGKASLKETFKHQKSLWDGISDLVFD